MKNRTEQRHGSERYEDVKKKKKRKKKKRRWKISKNRNGSKK